MGFSQMRQSELRAEENPTQVDADFTGPFLYGGIFDGFVHLDRSVVKQHIEASKRPESLLNQGLDRIRLGHIGPDRQRHPSRGLDLTHRLLRRRLVDIRHHHPGTFPGKLLGTGASYTGSGSGNDRDSTF